MGNSLNNCMPCDDGYRPRKLKANGNFVSYTDLPDMIKYNDLKLHKKFKHGYISKNIKATINE